MIDGIVWRQLVLFGVGRLLDVHRGCCTALVGIVRRRLASVCDRWHCSASVGVVWCRSAIGRQSVLFGVCRHCSASVGVVRYRSALFDVSRYQLALISIESHCQLSSVCSVGRRLSLVVGISQLRLASVCVGWLSLVLVGVSCRCSLSVGLLGVGRRHSASLDGIQRRSPSVGLYWRHLRACER